eukprot:scaffold7452_cov254-Alexandrium_tamarense.AAC.3
MATIELRYNTVLSPLLHNEQSQRSATMIYRNSTGALLRFPFVSVDGHGHYSQEIISPVRVSNDSLSRKWHSRVCEAISREATNCDVHHNSYTTQRL